MLKIFKKIRIVAIIALFATLMIQDLLRAQTAQTPNPVRITNDGLNNVTSAVVGTRRGLDVNVIQTVGGSSSAPVTTVSISYLPDVTISNITTTVTVTPAPGAQIGRTWVLSRGVDTVNAVIADAAGTEATVGTSLGANFTVSNKGLYVKAPIYGFNGSSSTFQAPAVLYWTPTGTEQALIVRPIISQNSATMDIAHVVNTVTTSAYNYGWDGTNWQTVTSYPTPSGNALLTTGTVSVLNIITAIGTKTHGDGLTSMTQNFSTLSVMYGVATNTTYDRIRTSNTLNSTQSGTIGAMNTASFLYGQATDSWRALVSYNTPSGYALLTVGTVSCSNCGGTASTSSSAITGTYADNSNIGAGTAKLAALPARANAAAPAWTENYTVPLSVDLSGALRVSGSSGGGVAQTQVRDETNTWTDVGYFTGNKAMPVAIDYSTGTRTALLTWQTASGTALLTTGTVSAVITNPVTSVNAYLVSPPTPTMGTYSYVNNVVTVTNAPGSMVGIASLPSQTLNVRLDSALTPSIRIADAVGRELRLEYYDTDSEPLTEAAVPVEAYLMGLDTNGSYAARIRAMSVPTLTTGMATVPVPISGSSNTATQSCTSGNVAGKTVVALNCTATVASSGGTGSTVIAGCNRTTTANKTLYLQHAYASIVSGTTTTKIGTVTTTVDGSTWWTVDMVVSGITSTPVLYQGGKAEHQKDFPEPAPINMGSVLRNYYTINTGGTNTVRMHFFGYEK